MIRREAFETESLIYVPFLEANQTWFSPSACLWSDTAKIAGKAGIKSHYSKLEEFFTSTLYVNEPNLSTLVEGLRGLSESESVSSIKSLIWQINSLSPTGNSLDDLLGASILPVRDPNGTIKLSKPVEDFGVIDRNHLADALEGHISLLNFNLEESRRLGPFLSCLQLKRRYLSRAVLERSKFQGGSEEPSACLTTHLRRRAYALTR